MAAISPSSMLLHLAEMLDKCHRLNPNNVETFAAPNVLAPHGIVTSHHIALGLSKTCTVAIVGSSWQLCFFPSYNPLHLIIPLLSAVRTRHHMGTLLWPFVEKVPFFHLSPRRLCCRGEWPHRMQSILTQTVRSQVFYKLLPPSSPLQCGRVQSANRQAFILVEPDAIRRTVMHNHEVRPKGFEGLL
jgi:hypothetical protein